jgi:hypothetical protein
MIRLAPSTHRHQSVPAFAKTMSLRLAAGVRHDQGDAETIWPMAALCEEDLAKFLAGAKDLIRFENASNARRVCEIFSPIYDNCLHWRWHRMRLVVVLSGKPVQTAVCRCEGLAALFAVPFWESDLMKEQIFGVRRSWALVSCSV